ncbi:MAG: hypothetical protein CML06_01270 [Pseudomonadales bacterium]|nr:hypothetical protein [Pseudomonadales bacterium]
MKTINHKKRVNPALASLVGLATAVTVNLGWADGKALDYDSLPPLISTEGSGIKPNVLIMLDTSGSMLNEVDGDYEGTNWRESRHIIARQAIAELLNNFSETVNMGLMGFQPGAFNSYTRQDSSWYSSPKQRWYSNVFTDNTYRQVALTHGFLYIPIGSVDPTATDTDVLDRIGDFNDRLGLDIVSQPAPNSGHYDFFEFDASNYVNSSDYSMGRIISWGGTPIEGAYDSALSYFDSNTSLPSNQYVSGLSSSETQWPVDDENECAKNYAILLTDGLPSVSTRYNKIQVNGRNYNWCSADTGAENYCSRDVLVSLTDDIVAKAEALQAAGVTTYVVGFGLDDPALSSVFNVTGDADTFYLRRMAVAGGTSTEYYANNLSQLTGSLGKIFVDIINRTSSGSGAAVVANRGNGLSADFQALYTPQRINGDQSVEWVGTLHGFFLDENNVLREDTNGDGLLGDYLTDRIIKFYYDETKKATDVDRMFGSGATDPAPNVSTTITAEIEDIASLWNARDQLAVVADLVNQRSYSANASSGRAIYTSTDGSTLQDFVAIDDAALQDAENLQNDLINNQIPNKEAEIQNSLNQLSNTSTLQTQLASDVDPAVQDTLNRLSNLDGTLIGDLQNGNQSLADLESDYNAADSDLNSKQSTYDSADQDLQNAQNDFSTADTNLQNANQDVTDAQTAYNQALADKQVADQAVADATVARDQAQSDLDAEQQLVDQAQSDLDAEQQLVDQAQSDLTAAQQVVDQAQADFDAVTSPPGSNPYDTALAALNAAIADRDAAQTTLTNATADRDAAQTVLTNATADRDAAQTTLNSRQTDLNNALSTQATETGEFNTADSNLTAAQTAQSTAQSTYNQADQDLQDAQSAFSQAQTDLAASQTAYDQALQDYQLADTYDWAQQIAAARTALDELLSQADNISNLTPAERDQLISDMSDAITTLTDLLNSTPDVSGVNDAQIPSLTDLVTTLETNFNTSVTMYYQSTATLDSIYEYAVNTDSLMDQLESLQAQLDNTSTDINVVDYIQYMDDNITGQADDVDLTYVQRNAIVNWTRGEEDPSLRNRTIDYDDDGNDEVWRLPDIVHSTPAVVGRPSDVYYSRYGDTTYRDYMNAKFNRRQVVYVGSNGGMLHAFNSGFWDDAQKGYVTQLSGDSATAHPLGAELWAFIPKAALPHLQFVADPAYAHMALVDGSPQAFDVNIFPDDTNHPGGWGTILVVNMRMGGGPFTVRVDEDEDGSTEDVVVRPSVFIFDVTNPEEKPELLAELSHPNMGYTLGKPALIKRRVAGATWGSVQENRWLLVFGSGPTDLDTATSDQNANLYAYDLNAREWASDWTDGLKTVTLEGNAYISDISVEDWDRDYVDDVLYFGVNTGDASAPDGRLARLRLRSDQGASGWLSNSDVSTLSDVGRTVIGAPLAKSDVYGQRWVYAGTGRVLVGGDNYGTQQEYFFGIKEPVDTSYELTYASVSTGQLLDISNIQVFTNPDEIKNGPSGVDNPAELAVLINESYDGWKRTLTHSGSNPSGRSDLSPTSYLNTVTFAEYIPSGDKCEPEGQSYLWTIGGSTGVADKTNYLDYNEDGNGQIELLPQLDMGQGKTGGTSGQNGGENVVHDSTGRVTVVSPYQILPTLRRQSWRQIFDIDF